MLPLPVPAPWSHCRESEKASRRDRRRRQLRLLLRAGPLLLRRGDGERAGAGADERRARRLPRRRHRDRLRLRHQRRQGRARRRRGDLRARRTTPSAFAAVPRDRASRVAARHDPRRARQVPARGDRGSRRARRPTSPRSSTRSRTDVLVSYLPVGSQQATEFYAEQALEAGCAFVNCIPVFIASDPNWRAALRGARAADRRRRHQEPGRRDDRAPGARQPLPRARRAARPHLPAQLRRQHRLPEHARARAARIEEDLEDPGRDEPARRAARRRATSMSARATSCRG